MTKHYTLPKESLMVKMAPIVMLMGMMISILGLILGFVASSNVADDAVTAQEFAMYVMPLTLTGVAFILMAVTIFLRGIFKGIRAMGLNVTDALNQGR